MEALNVAQPLPINEWHASVHSDLRNPLGETDAPLICHICLSPYLIAVDKKLDELRKKLDEHRKKLDELKKKYANILEDLRKDLQCPVCWDTPRRVPIFQCRNGHIICQDCQPKLQTPNCPQCRIPYGNETPIRALTAERCIRQIPHKCIYANQGCQQPPMALTDLETHERECEFRLAQNLSSDSTRI